MTHTRVLFRAFVCAAVCAAGCRGAGESRVVSESTEAAARAAWDTDADSMLHAGIVYRGRAAITVEAGRPMLVVRVEVRNTRADTATVDSNAATCHPPLYFRPPSAERTVAWSDHAWQTSTTPGVGCKGTGLSVPLGPLGSGELETRRYPVGAVRGDSLPAGTYAVALATVVYRSEPRPQGIVTRFDTLLVPAGRVRLP
jgi:hypothetical protein